ncbi:hypothetical protein SALLE_v1c08380 [Spiroplasma alleghenense]|uniref:Uncharacterized protein n=1 Tax=Spiroplasma alleghenense TaxID=216931 RepID=A0A345Z4H9_9MOLU|nr:hypothetical protein SALLE_v1c08380 [Spiroplasma alleghenense]
MKNRLIPSMLISLLLTLIITDLIAPLLFFQNDNWPVWGIVLSSIGFIILSLLIILYFFRNYLKKCPNWISKVYDVCFINFGQFKINQLLFLITVFVISGAITLGSSTAWSIIYTFLNIYTQINLDIVFFMYMLSFMLLLVYIGAIIWVILIYGKSQNFYHDVRWACLLLPLFGWIYFFTFQPSKRDLA